MLCWYGYDSMVTDLKRKDITLTMNQDLSQLIWGKGKNAEAKEIEQIVVGRKTPVFVQYDSKVSSPQSYPLAACHMDAD
jgi:hypothetical protein